MITDITRSALVDLFGRYEPNAQRAFVAFVVGAPRQPTGLAWWGRLDEIRFLERLYDLDALPSSDDRFSTARDDIRQHCMNNADWDIDWVLTDPRLELSTSDDKLLRFLAETLHPEVRLDRSEVESVRAAYNRLLRRDRFEIRQTRFVSGRPVFGGLPATPRKVSPDQLRQGIGQAIRHALSAGQVAGYCEALGMPGLSEGSYTAPMNNKAAYVVERIGQMPWPDLVGLARRVLEDYVSEPLADLMFEIALAAEPGVAGSPKNLVFASTGPKPDLVLIDAVNNDIEIVRNAEYCEVYDRPIDPEHGLSFQELVDWWADKHAIVAPRVAANKLHKRLLQAVPGPERCVFDEYTKMLKGAFTRPALLPQVYLHFDPKTVKERLGADGKKLQRQRMDFLMLLPGRRRLVIEIDGVQHYSHDQRPRPDLYAEMVSEDRRLRLAGYDVYRFGGAELVDREAAERLVRRFFEQLFERYSVA